MSDSGLVGRCVARLDELQRIVNRGAAGPWTTPGPDTVGEFGVYDADWMIATVNAYDHNIRYGASRGPAYIDPNANAALIVAAVNALPGMLSGWRAILDLHRPADLREGYVGPPLCDTCQYGEWPCNTIRAVAEALGVAL